MVKENFPLERMFRNIFLGIIGYFRQAVNGLGLAVLISLALTSTLAFYKWEIPVLIPEMQLWLQMVLLFFIIAPLMLFMRDKQVWSYFKDIFFGRIGHLISQYALMYVILNVFMMLKLSILEVAIWTLFADAIYVIVSVLVLNGNLMEIKI